VRHSWHTHGAAPQDCPSRALLTCELAEDDRLDGSSGGGRQALGRASSHRLWVWVCVGGCWLSQRARVSGTDTRALAGCTAKQHAPRPSPPARLLTCACSSSTSLSFASRAWILALLW
jgi:hypothetical protein